MTTLEECRNWAKFGECRYGENCRYSHGTPGVSSYYPPRRYYGGGGGGGRRRAAPSTQQCRQFKEGNCTYGDACRFRHGETDPRPMPKQPVCYEFRDTGKCDRPNCRFDHKFAGGAVASSSTIAASATSAAVTTAVASVAPQTTSVGGAGGLRRPRGRRIIRNKRSNICYNIQNSGKCDRPNCPFDHGTAAPATTAAASATSATVATTATTATSTSPDARTDERKKICYTYYNTGACTRTECPFVHMNPEEAKAQGINIRPRRRYNNNNYRYSYRPRPFFGTQPAECFEWQQSHACSRGEVCRFRHGKEDTRPLKPKGICFDFQKGVCTRENCRFEHTTPAGTTAPAAAKVTTTVTTAVATTAPVATAAATTVAEKK